jgi:DNA repair exonuclease SbcCD ATPase subunit
MIKRLTLKNWRNYEDATVKFEPGTTFVVASNGVGKTSLVEAARWAIFGMIAPGGNAAIRVGETSALAIVDLELPDLRVLTVERTLTGNDRRVEPPTAVRLDGASVPPEELNQHLMSAYGTEPSFLAGLIMPAIDRDHDKPSALGLEEHLGRYFGIDGLRNAIDQLEALRKANGARIRQIKNANSASSQRLIQLQSDAEQAARRIDACLQEHKDAQARVDEAREQQRLRINLQNWQEDYAAWAEAAEALAVRLSVDLGESLAVDSIERVLAERLAQLDQQIETVRIEVAVNAAKESALTANDKRLEAAQSDCPVCRRPLDHTTVTHAHETNSEELAAIRETKLRLMAGERELVAQREQAKGAQAEWRRIPRPGQPPQAPAADDAGSAPGAQIAAIAEAALNTLVEARAASVQATRELEQARVADKAMRELESRFSREASLRVAIEATESTLMELLNGTIRPLATQVDQRWKELFPGRGDLNTHPDGNITRTVNGHPLPYDAFSTGESMSVTILLRLLVAEMATTTNFCWFDEPLEHLDPDVRRKVANLLSRVTSADGPLKQVVVTTYEEPLARHLQARDNQRVKLLDVRQAV